MAVKIPFPSTMAPNRMSAALVYNTSTYRSTFTGRTITVENPGEFWEFSLNYSNLDLNLFKNKLIVEALVQVRGMSGRLQLHHMAYPETSGALNTADLVSNGDFLLAGSGWTETLGTAGKAKYEMGRLTITQGTLGTPSVSRSVSLVSGEYYVAHFAVKQGTTGLATMSIGTTSGSANTATLAAPAPGRHHLGFVAGASNFITLGLTAGAGAGDFLTLSDIRISRACRTSGTSQTGTQIVIKDLPTNTDNVLNSLDFVSINGELKRLVSSVDSGATGTATLIIEPAMRKPALSNSVVVFNRPFIDVILDTKKFMESLSLPILSSFTIKVSEALL